jgi:hypothetical protein
MSKHTPKPWHWGYDYYGLFGENDEPVLCYMPFEGMDLECRYDREKANARLIAAAPDLLEALRLAVRQNSHDMLLTGEELRQCEAAIAKAEGK